MSTFQKTIVIGHLGSDPLTKHFDGGSQLTQLSIATTEHWSDKSSGEKKELTEWHRIVLNGKLSELAEKYLKKGSKVLIEGKLKTRKYTDASNIERYTTEIVGQNMTFMSSSNSSESNQNTNESSAVDQYMNKQPNNGIENPPSSSEEHDDLPF